MSPWSRYWLVWGRPRVRSTTSLFLRAEDGIRDRNVTGVQTCALPISTGGVVGEYLAVRAGGVHGALVHREAGRHVGDRAELGAPQQAAVRRAQRGHPAGRV